MELEWHISEKVGIKKIVSKTGGGSRGVMKL